MPDPEFHMTGAVMAELVCWKCGASLEDLSLPLRRLDECRKCGAELHVCRLCEWYSPTVAKQCREPVAEEVKDKERANFCDYFKPRPGAYVAADVAAVARAKSELDELFGGTGTKSAEEPSAAERARAELEKLFGK
jgi:ribosomal protein L40E